MCQFLNEHVSISLFRDPDYPIICLISICSSAIVCCPPKIWNAKILSYCDTQNIPPSNINSIKTFYFMISWWVFLDASKCQCIFIQNAFTNGVTFNYINGYKSRFILLLPSVCCLIDINANLITINLFDGIAVLSDVNMKGEVLYGAALLCHIMTITEIHMPKRIFITIIPISWLSISHSSVYYIEMTHMVVCQILPF